MSGRACLAVAILASFAACASDDDSLRVSVGPSLSFPRSLLDRVAKLTLTVYDSAETDCAGATLSGNPSRKVSEFQLASAGCGDGVKFCGDVLVARSASERVFFAQGFDGGQALLAVGCVKAKVDQDALPLEITMRRFVPAAVCGNGTLEPTEQCEPKGSDADPLCDAECHTKEIYLSGGKGAAGTTAPGKPGDKKAPFLLWPQGGRFVALFTDRTPTPSEVTMRVLSDAMTPYGDQGAEMRDYSFFLPNNPAASFPPKVEGNRQNSPVAAAIGQKYYVAFEDDGRGTTDIRLRSLDRTFTPEQGPLAALGINGQDGAGEPGEQRMPSMAAGANGLLFITWQDEAAGAIWGRTFEPGTASLGPLRQVSSGSSNKGAVVAAAGSSGWVVTWESGSDVKLRSIKADGSLGGAEKTVNDKSHSGAQSHPSVAGLPDGRFAVVWNDRGRTDGDVFVQRFAANGTPVEGDQARPINDVVGQGEQHSPSIASVSAAGGAYAAVWVDATSGEIRARFLGGSADFLFNNVDAQNSEFAASTVDGRLRAAPVAAAGGTGPFVAIGWEDTTDDAQAGIYARRFPAPSD